MNTAKQKRAWAKAYYRASGALIKWFEDEDTRLTNRVKRKRSVKVPAAVKVAEPSVAIVVNKN